MSNTRDEIIDAASRLLEEQGYSGTGLAQILAASGAPKGSLYHYFPDGKDGLTAEAIERVGRQTAERIRHNIAVADDPAEAMRAFVLRIAQAVEKSGFRAGGPLQIVAMETATTNPRLNEACRAAYSQLQAAFAEKFLSGGCSQAQAERLSTLVTALIEGGIILSRTYHSGDPLRQVAGCLAAAIQAEMAHNSQ